MDAVIYAAGRATRLGPAHADRPKILLEVGGQSLLGWHAQHLRSVGAERLHIVTGHGRNQILNELPKLSEVHGLDIHEIFNPDYCEGSVLSMNVSLPVLEATREPVLIMDGDVFYDRELLQQLVRTTNPSALLVDYGFVAQDEDPVLTPIRNGRPFELLKQWQGTADRVGESVGFFKIAPAHLPMLIKETQDRCHGLRRRDSLDEVLRALTRADCFAALDITGLPWTEIDYPYDLEYARETVLPAVEQRQRIQRQSTA